MGFPATPRVEIRFGTGAGFGDVLILGSATDGILGTNVLGTSTAIPVEVTALVQTVTIRRGRDRVFDHYDSGNAVITLIDETGDLNPDNASGPYYGDILPMRQVKIWATYDGDDYYLFSGYITSWDYEYPKGATFAQVTIKANDGFRLLNLAQIDGVSGAAAGDLTGTRVTQILNASGWPAGRRDISAGDLTVQNDPGGRRSALSALQVIEDTELGALYMAPNGDAVFRSNSAIASQAAGTPVYFDDQGINVQYQTIDVTLDDTDLANNVTITRLNGTDQNAYDTASISDYFQRSLTRSGLLMETDSDALDQANAILAYRKNVQLLITSVGLDLSSPSDRVAAALELDIGDPIQVIRTGPGGAITADLTVQRITHQIRPGSWVATLGTAVPLAA